MNKPHINFEKYTEIMSASTKEKSIIAPFIPKPSGVLVSGGRGHGLCLTWVKNPAVRVVDFGAGTGELSCYLKRLAPERELIAIDNDPAMREILAGKDVFKQVAAELSEVQEPVEAVIFNAVLHEVNSYGTPIYREANRNLEGHFSLKGSVVDILTDAYLKLSSQGRIIIRDGFLAEKDRHVEVDLKTKDFDTERYIREYAHLHKKLHFNGKTLSGDFRDIVEFLNKASWGMASYEREILEKINFLTAADWRELLEQIGFRNIMVKTYMQPSYFFHLQEIADIQEVWDTHILIVAEKGGR